MVGEKEMNFINCEDCRFYIEDKCTKYDVHSFPKDFCDGTKEEIEDMKLKRNE